jgi:hypothetical protein
MNAVATSVKLSKLEPVPTGSRDRRRGLRVAALGQECVEPRRRWWRSPAGTSARPSGACGSSAWPAPRRRSR